MWMVSTSWTRESLNKTETQDGFHNVNSDTRIAKIMQDITNVQASDEFHLYVLLAISDPSVSITRGPRDLNPNDSTTTYSDKRTSLWAVELYAFKQTTSIQSEHYILCHPLMLSHE